MPDPHGFEARYFAKLGKMPTEREVDALREAFSEYLAARLGDRQELVVRVFDALVGAAPDTAAMFSDSDYWQLAQAALNAVADHLGFEGLRDG